MRLKAALVATIQQFASKGVAIMPAAGGRDDGDPISVPQVHDMETIAGGPSAQSGRAQAPGGDSPAPAGAGGGAANLEEFTGALVELGLAGAAEVAAYATDAGGSLVELSRALVKAGKITAYQAAAIYQKKSRGLVIGNYLILDKLGQGGMGVVFKARHRRLGRLGALKILPPSFARDQTAVLRFRREVEAAGRLKHPNLVAAVDADEDRGVHFLVMDYVEGRDLDHVVRQRGPLPVAQAVDCLIQAARGLEAAHGQGIVHRDIKPANLMLDSGGTIRVLDLGLARVVDAGNPFNKTAAGRLTQSGMYMGTIDYMAPEQAEDSHRVDQRADIYSLGCTLYYLLTGKEPFPAESVLKRLLAHMEHPEPTLRAARDDVPPALDRVYQRMMAKRPDDRPSSMSEVIALLEASMSSAEATEAVAKNARSASAPSESERALWTIDESPLKGPGAPSTKADPAVFARADRDSGSKTDDQLRLEDLLMDVRSEAPATKAAAARKSTAPASLPLKRPPATARARPRRRNLVFLSLGAAVVAAASYAGFAILFRPAREKAVRQPRPATIAGPESSREAAAPATPPPPIATTPKNVALKTADRSPMVEAPKEKPVVASTPAKPRPAAAEPAASKPHWIALGKKNHYLGNIPGEMSQALADLTNKKQDVKWITFAPDGGWVILYGRNGHVVHDIAREASQAIDDLAAHGIEIKSINFAPKGGWVILHGRRGFRDHGVPSEVVKALTKARTQGLEPLSISFGPNEACVIIFHGGHYFERNAPENLRNQLLATRFSNGVFFFTTDGGYVLFFGPRLGCYRPVSATVELASAVKTLSDNGEFQCASIAMGLAPASEGGGR
jgi:serine/threonine protein kinase